MQETKRAPQPASQPPPEPPRQFTPEEEDLIRLCMENNPVVPRKEMIEYLIAVGGL
jgi:hypothetical protein